MATYGAGRPWRDPARGRDEPMWPWLLLTFLVLLALGLVVPFLAGWVSVDLG